MEKAYSHKSEDHLYKSWEKSGKMRADANSSKPPFTIPLPPPNVTGTLHLGHAAMLAIEDILIRFKKMTGHEVLWVPGTDHAAIATENVVIKHLGAKSREEYSREEFLGHCREFAADKHDTIVNQMKKMGAWLDWSREAYTFDEERNFAVNKIFKDLYEDGLIVRGHRLINWSTGAQSVLADDEVEWEDRAEPFYYIKCGKFVIGTVRSETKCADSPLIVHPTEKYVEIISQKNPQNIFIISAHLWENQEQFDKIFNQIPETHEDFSVETTHIGKDLEGIKFEAETFAGTRKFYVLADEVIDLEKGSGSMTISCNHSADDYELGKRIEKSPLTKGDLGEFDLWIDKLNFEGKMNAIAGECEGLPVEKARKKSAEMMREQGILVGEDKTYIHNVPLCYRSGSVVEPMVSPQWFISVEKEFESERLQTFVFVRHGQSEDNLNSIVGGHRQSSLTNKGVAQALATAEQLRDRKISKIISSDLPRALQTAEEIKKTLGLDVEIETSELLREADYGEITGTEEIHLGNGGGSNLRRSLKANTGEAYRDLLNRAQNTWKKLKSINTEGEILIVSHNTFLCTIFAALEGISTEEDLIQFRKRWNLKNAEAKIISLPNGKTETTTLKKQMQAAVRENHVKIIPERFDKEYFRWIDNLQDWCISRQIWWGHRIPVWYDESGEIAAVGELTEAQRSQNLRQDEDTLDTWFSSALWPFSTLGWPNIDSPLDKGGPGEISDFSKFYPTSVLETGWDILFFWVARMIMFGKYATGSYPFHTVYLHGMVTDEHGKKMSKSKGNGIDPLDMIKDFGADPVRLALVIGSTPGQKIPIGKAKISGYRNFVNKLWNAGRFVQMQCEQKGVSINPPDKGKLGSLSPESLAEKWILHRFGETSEEVKNYLEKFDISKAGDQIYHFVWNDFCDWFIEVSKVDVRPEFLAEIYAEILKLAHPLCPFVTEQIWKDLFGAEDLLLEENFPEIGFRDQKSLESFQLLQEIIGTIRSIRAEKKLNPKEKLVAGISVKNIDQIVILKSSADITKLFANLSDLQIGEDVEKGEHVVSQFIGNIEISVEIPFDPEAEKMRLEKELEQITKKVSGLEGRLANKSYTEKAPAHLVEQTREELEKAQETLDQLKSALTKF